MRPPIFTNYSSRFIIPQHLVTRISLLLLTLGFFGGVWGQVILTNGVPSSTIDFSSNTPTSIGSNPSSAFNGSGFEVNPATSGRLNSNSWAVTGWSNGSLAFGGTQTSAGTDYTRGSISVATTTGGIYAYTGTPQSTSNPCLMLQPGSGDWAPGTLTLRIQNNGTTNITALAISYNLYVRNDQARSNSFNFSYSSDNFSYTNISSLDYTSTAVADANPTWALVGTAPSRTTTITGLDIAPSEYYYIRWSGADVGGSGSRDEFGLDDIYINATYAVTCTTGEWIGGTTGNWNDANNWCGGVPSSSSSVVIGSGNSITLNVSPTTVSSLTIAGSLTVPTNNQLTLTGALTNNGTLTLENGATFKQGTSVSGGGTYNIKQNLDNCAGSGSTLTGRYWYLGSPVTSLRENSFGNAGNLNKVWSFTNGAYTAIADGATLSPTTGYVHRRGSNALPLTFTGTNLYAQDVTLSLSNNAGTYGGWHLIANPYTAYLDWHQVYNASNALSSAISPSYYIRSFNGTGNDVNALITYNSSTGLESNTSSLSLTSAQAQYIAPMQAIWVKVNPTTPLSATAGQLRLERAFTSHQTGNVGLKSSTVFPTLARVNLVDGARFDQMLVYMNPDMTNGVDQYDSEKLFVSGASQLYTMAAGKKLVMNGLKKNKSKISVPLYLELPESKVYQLSLAEYILDDGLILLEDKQEGTIQDFTIYDVYSFYATSGVLQNRFVLHFFKPDNGITAQGPSNSWVEEEAVINEGGSILVNSNGRGMVTIQQDIDQSPTAKGSVLVRDAAGREVWKGQLSGSATNLELDTPSGIYFVEVELNGQVEMKKIFVQ